MREDYVLIRGGGDLASGAAIRLHRSGMRIIITELEKPLVIRRSVSFAEAVYQGNTTVEDVAARRVDGLSGVRQSWSEGTIPILIDPDCDFINLVRTENQHTKIPVLVDARMTKKPPELGIDSASLVIGLGPGFSAGVNCHVVIETNRGHFLGRVIWKGSASANTGIPEGFGGKFEDRVLRSPAEGVFLTEREIGERLKPGDKIAEVDGQAIRAPFKGVLRGLLHHGLYVKQGFKVGDIDPRDDPSYCRYVSDKSLAVGGGVLEAILSARNQ